jgi:hypothetical protein
VLLIGAMQLHRISDDSPQMDLNYCGCPKFSYLDKYSRELLLPSIEYQVLKQNCDLHPG